MASPLCACPSTPEPKPPPAQAHDVQPARDPFASGSDIAAIGGRAELNGERDGTIPIGEFARLCGLSVKALRHYHELGLLEPASVDPQSGYRYYRSEQALRAAAIRGLRDLAMPLGEIRGLLEAGRPEDVKSIVGRHRARLVADLESAKRRLALVERFVMEGHAMLDQAREVDLPPLHAATVHIEGSPSMAPRLGEAAASGLQSRLARDGIVVAGTAVLLLHRADEERFEIELCLPIPKDARPRDDVVVRDIDACRAAVVRHAGPWEEGYVIVQALMGWARDRGHAIAMPLRAYILGDTPGTTGLSEPVCDYAVVYG